MFQTSRIEVRTTVAVHISEDSTETSVEEADIMDFEAELVHISTTTVKITTHRKMSSPTATKVVITIGIAVATATNSSNSNLTVVVKVEEGFKETEVEEMVVHLCKTQQQ